MPVQGLVRLRKHQLGRQAAMGTKVAATRVYPFKGVPDVNLNWTDPEVDLGSLDPVAAPRREAPELTANYDIPQLDYNTLAMIHAGFFGGGVEPTGGGTAQTWTFSPASETVDEPDLFTEEFGDDVLTDWYQFGDGIVESFELTAENKGVLTGSLTMRYGSVSSTGSTDSPVTGSVPTPDLVAEKNPALVYLKDGAIYIADTVAGLSAGQITDALHAITIRGSGDIDEKRYANGTQEFDVDAYARATRVIEVEATYAKTADTVGTGSESDHWLSDEAVDRYIRLVFVSKVLAQSPSTDYGWTVTMPARYYTRTEGEQGGNSTVVLTARAFYDADDLGGVFESVIVNTLTGAVLGLVGS